MKITSIRIEFGLDSQEIKCNDSQKTGYFLLNKHNNFSLQNCLLFEVFDVSN